MKEQQKESIQIYTETLFKIFEPCFHNVLARMIVHDEISKEEIEESIWKYIKEISKLKNV